VLKHKVNNGFASVGDEIVVIVNRARPVPATTASRSAFVTDNSHCSACTHSIYINSNAIKVRRGDVRRAVVVRTKKPVRRPDGRIIRCVYYQGLEHRFKRGG